MVNLDVYVHVFDQVWAPFQPLFLRMPLPTPLSQTYSAAGLTAGILQASFGAGQFLSNLFSFYSSDSLNPIKVTDFSAYLNLPFELFSEFFISVSEL